MSSDSMHSGHRRRMRKRFLDTGGSGFRDHELMELMLYYVIPRGNTNETAHRLIKKFGSISAVLDADRSELLSVGGIGEAGASMIKLMGDLCRSYALSVHRQIKFSSYDELECYISYYFSESCSIVLSAGMQYSPDIYIPERTTAAAAESINAISLTERLILSLS